MRKVFFLLLTIFLLAACGNMVELPGQVVLRDGEDVFLTRTTGETVEITWGASHRLFTRAINGGPEVLYQGKYYQVKIYDGIYAQVEQGEGKIDRKLVVRFTSDWE